jgi:hypothetical protein
MQSYQASALRRLPLTDRVRNFHGGSARIAHGIPAAPIAVTVTSRVSPLRCSGGRVIHRPALHRVANAPAGLAKAVFTYCASH